MRGERLAIVALVALGACETDPTQLVVVVQTDMRVPAELAGFATRVGPTDGQPTDERTFWLDDREGAVTLPASFGVAPVDGDADRRVRIEIAALRADETEIFETHAVTGFVEGLKLRLNMFLAGQCETLAVTCPEGFTCTEDGCVEDTVSPRDLDPFDGIDGGGVEPADGGGLPTDEDWAIVLAEGVRARITAAAADDAGNFFAALVVDAGPGVLDGEPFVAAGPAFAILAVAPDGSFLWHPVLWSSEDPAYVAPAVMVFDDAGLLVMAGALDGEADLGQGPEVNDVRAAFLARYAADTGVLTRADMFAAPDATVTDVAYDHRGLAVVGTFQNDLAIPDNDPLYSAELQGFVAHVADEGGFDCAFSVPATSSMAQSIRYDHVTGGIVVAGTFSGDLQADPAPLYGETSSDGFVMGLSDCTPFVGASLQIAVEVDGVRTVKIDDQSLLVGATSDPYAGAGSFYFAVLDDVGVVFETSHGGEDSDDRLVALAPLLRSATVAAAAGTFTAEVNLGAVLLGADGALDSFVAGVAPNATLTWVDEISGPGAERVQALAAVPDASAVYAAGAFTSTVTIGSTTLETDHRFAVFLYRKIAPP